MSETISMSICRLHYTREKDCINRQLAYFRRTRKGKLNIMFSSCVRPEPCKRWLSDEEYYAAQSAITRYRHKWEAKS